MITMVFEQVTIAKAEKAVEQELPVYKPTKNGLTKTKDIVENKNYFMQTFDLSTLNNEMNRQ